MKFGVGVIGATGYIGVPYRSEIRESPEDAKIVALCARRRNLLEQAATEDGADLITANWQEVVQHPDVNLVLVATPDALHYQAVMACAENGKHVVCEKPVGSNAEEARAMLSACNRAKLAHFVPFWTRYVPVFVEARKRFQAGQIGQIQLVVYRWHNPRPTAMPFTWRDDAALSASGSIGDVGSHAYDVIRWMIGSEARNVLAHACVLTPAKPDLGDINLSEAIQWGERESIESAGAKRTASAVDYANLSFELQNGAVGVIVLSHSPFVRKGLAPELELHGTEGSLAIDRLNCQIRIARTGSDETESIGVPDSGYGNRFAKHVFPALRSQLDDQPCEHPTMEDGLRVQTFTDAALQSAERGSWISLDP